MATNEKIEFNPAVITDARVQVLLSGKAYEIDGKNDISITSNVTNDIVFSKDGTRSGVIFKSGLNTPDEITIRLTHPSSSVIELLEKVYKEYTKKFQVVILTDNGDKVFCQLNEAILAKRLLQTNINDSADEKLEILFKGRLSYNELE